ncbi:MAG: hypothetical protein RJA25_2629 [Bacteroidota bacterium]|jgi:hypothetical protein
MKDFFSKYRTETLVLIAILLVIYIPYFIINSGIIKSEESLLMADTLTKYFTPIIISGLVFIIVYKAIKQSKDKD